MDAAAAVQLSLLALMIQLSAFLAGGFQPEMNRREAALILGVRESAPEEKVRLSKCQLQAVEYDCLQLSAGRARERALGKGATGDEPCSRCSPFPRSFCVVQCSVARWWTPLSTAALCDREKARTV